MLSGGNFVSTVGVPVAYQPTLEKRDVREGKEVVEVVNSYLSIPVTSFPVSRIEQVDKFERICIPSSLECFLDRP